MYVRSLTEYGLPRPMAFLTELATNASMKNVQVILYSGNDDSLVSHRGTQGRYPSNGLCLHSFTDVHSSCYSGAFRGPSVYIPCRQVSHLCRTLHLAVFKGSRGNHRLPGTMMRATSLASCIKNGVGHTFSSKAQAI